MNVVDAGKAARLVGYALDHRQRPTPDSDYRALLDRYQTDGDFAELTDRVAEGLGLYVRAVTRLGLVVAGDPDGPFAVTIDTSGLPLRTGQHRLQDRRCFGLALVALVAYAYPDGEDLVSTTNPTVRAEELHRFLNAHVGAVAEIADRTGDELDAQLGEAARMWLDLPEVLPNQRGGMRADCQRAYVQRLLEQLVDTGRARREPALADERGDVYALNDRFRVGIAEVCETVAFSILTGTAPDAGPAADVDAVAYTGNGSAPGDQPGEH